MNSDLSSTSDFDRLKGLPPVTPPSGKFIARLFLIPLLIVGGIALVFFGIIWLFGDVLGGLGGMRTPAQFLDKLDRSNPDVRWRAAADLAQVLLRDDQMASDPRFALDLTDRLRKGMDTSAATEKAITDRLRKQPHLVPRLSKLVQNQPDPERDASDAEWKALEADWKKLEPDLNYVMYLSACLGNFMLPTGAPLLSELAMREGAEVNVPETLQRRRAVWALANLGENLGRFDRLPSSRQEAVLEALEKEAAGSGARAEAARATLENLRERPAGRPPTLGVAVALVRCAETDQPTKREPFLRELAGFAMGFWPGSEAEGRLMDDALVKLTHDAGAGDEMLEKLFLNEKEQEQDALPVTRDPGIRIQYNAAVALARRGSERVRLDMLEDMLDEGLQMKQHLKERKDGSKVADEATAYLTVLTALKAVQELHNKQPDRLVGRASLAAAVEKLAQSKNPAVRTEAERTRILLSPPR